jgi:putative endonuclease
MPSLPRTNGTINKRLLGSRHEKYACRYLKRRGFKQVTSNYSCRLGEIDLVMLDAANTLVFIEVRFRKNDRFGSALDTVDFAKQGRVRRTAASFLQAHSSFKHHSCRFDVIAITSNPDSNNPLINWVKNAFY